MNTMNSWTRCWVFIFLLCFEVCVAPAQATAQAAVPSLKNTCAEVGTASLNTLYSNRLKNAALNGSALDVYLLGTDVDLVGPWIVSMAPRIESRLGGYYTNLRLATNFAAQSTYPAVPEPAPTRGMQTPTFQNLKTYLEYHGDHGVQYTDNVKTTVDNFFEHRREASDVKNVKLALPYFCSKYANFGCAQAGKRALDVMAPTTGSYVYLSLIEETKEILIDASYIKPLSIAALTIMNKVQNASSGAPVEGTIFEDIYDAFLQSGFSETDAENRVYKVLAVYSTRGASFEGFALERFRTAENTAAIVPFFVIASGMNVLDAYRDLQMQNNDTHYSLPSNIKTTCVPTKPYHFWNAAYIARKVHREGHLKNASARGMLLLGRAYSVFSNTYGRNPYAIYKSSYLSATLNSHRLDSLFQTFGAMYGVRRSTHAFMGDKAFQAMVRHGDQQALKNVDFNKVVKNKILHYDTWRRIIAPDWVWKTGK